MSDRIRVVTFGSDAIGSPTYGGEQRSEGLNRIYRDHAESWRIEPTYVYDRHFMTYFRPAKPRPFTIVRKIRDFWHGAPPDLVVELGNRPKAAAELNRELARYRRLVDQADVVQFEHPFAYPFFASQLEGKAVIYSSHNIESQILADYFQRMLPDANEFQRLDSRIRRWESELVRRADLVIACTERDSRHYRDAGARRLCLATNGARPLRQLDSPALANVPFEQYVLFISSAWRPNVDSLLAYCAGLELPEGSGVVCVGGIGDAMVPGVESLRTNPSFHFTGEIDEDRLAAIATGSKALIVPMLAAGGSNIKTAQALMSSKPLIATPDALRGFEAFAASAGVHVHETPRGFAAEIARQLEAEPREFERADTRVLRWSEALRPACRALEELIMSRRASRVKDRLQSEG